MKNLKELELYDGEIPRFNDDDSYNRQYHTKPAIQPYLVYTALKDIFGEPNSNSFDEDKTQWEWVFRYRKFYVEICDWKIISTSIGIFHEDYDKLESEKFGEEIVQLLSEFSERNQKRLKIKAKESNHKLLENPFFTYYHTAENLLFLSRSIDEIILDKSGNTSKIYALFDKRNDLHRSAFLMLLSAFEGFLNILYELYLKAELRTDRIKEKLSREQIDLKLTMAPLYCDGFITKTIDQSDIRFKNFLKLINLRNDYVHAKLTKSLERYVVEEDNYTFIIENEDIFQIPSNINQLEYAHIEIAKKIIDEIVEMVILSMQTKTKREFKKIIFEPALEVEDIDGILIPLF